MRLFLLFMFCAGLASAQDANRFPPRLLRPLEFANFTVTDIVSQVEASNLMSKKVFIGENGTDAYNILGTNWTGPRIYVDSATDYEAAIKAGYKPYTTFEVAMTSWFVKPTKTLEFMEKAQPSIHALFQTKDLKYLPVSLLNWNDTDQKKQLDDDTARGMTLKDYTASHIKRHIPSIKIKGNTVSFSDDECDYVVTELARGDFDHDGYEDALISVGTKYQGGEGAYFEYFLVSKTDPKQRQLKIMAFDQAMAGDIASTNTTPAKFQSILAKAKTGDTYSEFQLARCYLEGLGVKQSDSKALKWFEKAGEQGIPEAQMVVGGTYWLGQGVKMDEAKGVKWFERAADLGEPGAFFYLGASYYLGKGVKQDYMQSYKWTLLFRESGHSVITNDMADVDAKLADLEGRLTPRQLLEAKMLEKDLKVRLSMFARFSEDDGNKESKLPVNGFSYSVSKGDTLDAIASAYKKVGVDVTVEQIVAANPELNLSTNLVAGTNLFIPDKNSK